MKKFLMAFSFWLLALSSASAQDMKMRDVFRQMPDSLMPYLTHNNRLDFIDFLDSNMKAEVKNLLGGTSEMTSLADDSLSIRMSETSKLDLLLLPLQQPVDSMTQVVVMIETFVVDSIYGESQIRYYSPQWLPLQHQPMLSEEQGKRINEHTLQNILKRDDKVLNKR